MALSPKVVIICVLLRITVARASCWCQNDGACVCCGRYSCSKYGPCGTCTPCESECPCRPDPCQNGGTCSVQSFAFQCACPTLFTGARCEQFDECYSSPCQNGGTCIDENKVTRGDLRCDCPPGYEGQFCQTDIDECASSPCINGAECSESIGKYACSCKKNFRGLRCETISCQNGGAPSIFNSSQCEYSLGFSGQFCETNINECVAHPCLNGGSCKDGVAGFKCDCLPGFHGDLCEQDIDECAEAGVNCMRGTCKNTYGGYVCTCPRGYEGKTCEFDVNECGLYPCQNNSTCVDLEGRRDCLCAENYSGENFESACQICQAGEYETVSCTKTTARVCSPCTACSLDQTLIKNCTAAEDTVCTSVSARPHSTNLFTVVISSCAAGACIILALVLLRRRRTRNIRLAAHHRDSHQQTAPSSVETSIRFFTTETQVDMQYDEIDMENKVHLHEEPNIVYIVPMEQTGCDPVQVVCAAEGTGYAQCVQYAASE